MYLYYYRIYVFYFTVILYMRILVRLFYLLCSIGFLTRVLTSISILLLFFIVNSICSVIANIKERINKIENKNKFQHFSLLTDLLHSIF